MELAVVKYRANTKAMKRLNRQFIFPCVGALKLCHSYRARLLLQYPKVTAVITKYTRRTPTIYTFFSSTSDFCPESPLRLASWWRNAHIRRRSKWHFNKRYNLLFPTCHFWFYKFTSFHSISILKFFTPLPTFLKTEMQLRFVISSVIVFLEGDVLIGLMCLYLLNILSWEIDNKHYNEWVGGGGLLISYDEVSRLCQTNILHMHIYFRLWTRYTNCFRIQQILLILLPFRIRFNQKPEITIGKNLLLIISKYVINSIREDI